MKVIRLEGVCWQNTKGEILLRDRRNDKVAAAASDYLCRDVRGKNRLGRNAHHRADVRFRGKLDLVAPGGNGHDEIMLSIREANRKSRVHALGADTPVAANECPDNECREHEKQGSDDDSSGDGIHGIASQSPNTV